MSIDIDIDRLIFIDYYRFYGSISDDRLSWQVGHASAVTDHAISAGHNIKWDHFEVLASGRCNLHCKIKETLFIRDLKPTLNDKVGSEQLWLY